MCPYLVLLQTGFALPLLLPEARCALTAPFHPYLKLTPKAVYFLWHFPSTHAAQTLSGVLPYGARTFLPSCERRLPDQLDVRFITENL